MNDLSHNFGADLSVSAGGDLLPVTGLALSQQRIIRRLLTNPGDYIWQPTYGAGVRKAIGTMANNAAVLSAIKAQLAQEQSVAQTPAPVVTLTPIQGGISVSISYTDTQYGPTVLSFTGN